MKTKHFFKKIRRLTAFALMVCIVMTDLSVAHAELTYEDLLNANSWLGQVIYVPFDREIVSEDEIRIEAGKTYRLVETVAPDGYAYTESITFTVNSDGTVNVNRDNVSDNTILMKDDLTFLSVNKVDKNGAPVAGAKLVIRDADGIPVTDILTSGKEAIVVRGLAAGKYI